MNLGIEREEEEEEEKGDDIMTTGFGGVRAYRRCLSTKHALRSVEHFSSVYGVDQDNGDILLAFFALL